MGNPHGNHKIVSAILSLWNLFLHLATTGGGVVRHRLGIFAGQGPYE
jgi:hypothetical protein